MNSKLKSTLAGAVAFGLVLSATTVSLSSCAGNVPSEEQAKQVWWTGHDNMNASSCQLKPNDLVSFKRTNSVRGEVFGVKTYKFQYEATLRCNGNCWFPYTEPTECKAGQIVVARGSLMFHMTDNGWVTGRL